MKELNEDLKAKLNAYCNKGEELLNLLHEMYGMEKELDAELEKEDLFDEGKEYLRSLSPDLETKIAELY